MIGLGTATIGRPHYINIKTANKNNDSFDLEKFTQNGITFLNEAYNQGIRHFDTAPGYGIAEQILLKWIALENPKDITVSTKWGYTYVADFDLKATQHEVKEHSIAKLNEQWEQSILLLPHLKIYQVHSATLDSGVLENTEVLDKLFELKKEYKIELGLSVSGDNQNEIIKKALQVAINGESLFDSFQITFNVFDQSLLEINKALIECGKKVIIKEALANGRIFPNSKYPQYQKTYSLLQSLAKKYAVGVDAIALRFCLDLIAPYSVLSGASEEKHLEANLKASKIKLTSDELISLKSLAVDPIFYWDERKKLAWN
jgi:aryl-alcohol dehydrogenase-like predicted oxidoreductase|tara:strand:- start:2023 stop:2970 length:948 start_codon:yes stop_codon:yes gene_type:complete